MKRLQSFLNAAKKRPISGRLILAPRRAAPPAPRLGQPRTVNPSGTKISAAERRRVCMTYLAGFIVVTFLLGMLAPLKFFLWPCLFACILFVAYFAAAAIFAAKQTSGATAVASPPEEVPTFRAAEGGL